MGRISSVNRGRGRKIRWRKSRIKNDVGEEYQVVGNFIHPCWFQKWIWGTSSRTSLMRWRRSSPSTPRKSVSSTPVLTGSTYGFAKISRKLANLGCHSFNVFFYTNYRNYNAHMSRLILSKVSFWWKYFTQHVRIMY